MWWKTSVTLLLLMCVRADSLSNLQVCGRPNSQLNPRIVGGLNSTEGAWPWMVSLRYYGNHICGGSLINNEWVLTAAHCVNLTRSNMLVYLGKWRRYAADVNEITRTVSNIIPHPSYNSTTYDNDIALLQLSSTVHYSDYIKPVCLADEQSNFPPGTRSWATGWGRIGVSGKGGIRGRTTVSVPLPPPGILQEVKLKVYSNADCNSICHGRINPNMICAGTRSGGKATFSGDSGGPLVSKQCSVWVQAGVVSHGYGCAQPNLPEVFIRVSEYKQWITAAVGGNLPGFVHFDPTCLLPNNCVKLRNCFG